MMRKKGVLFRSRLCHRTLFPDLVTLKYTTATVLHQPLIEPNDVKWRLAGQRAATVLNCAAQADIVRASALCRVVRRGDDVRQVEKRLIDAELSVAYRLNPPGIDAGGEARGPEPEVVQWP